MSKAYLKSLNFDKTRQLIYQNKTLAAIIPGDILDAAKINGQRLQNASNGNQVIVNSIKDKLKLDDK